MRLDRDEGFGDAFLAQLLVIARHRRAIDRACAILAGDGFACRDLAQRAQHLDLLVAHRGRIEMRGRLHCDQREQLQHVVLHHVADRAGIIIERHAPLEANGFGDCDLHVIDVGGVPERLEHQVGKAQREQVLHRLLAEIVVDPENPAFGESARHRVIDHAAGGQIGAQWLFEAHPYRLARQPRRLQAGDGGAEQARRGREENREAARGRADLGGETGIAFQRGRIQCLVAEPVEEFRHPSTPVCGEIFLQCGTGEIAVFGVVQLAAGGADDLEIGRQQPVGIKREQARQQHPLGKITGGSEQQQAVSGKAHAQRPLFGVRSL